MPGAVLKTAAHAAAKSAAKATAKVAHDISLDPTARTVMTCALIVTAILTVSVNRIRK